MFKCKEKYKGTHFLISQVLKIFYGTFMQGNKFHINFAFKKSLQYIKSRHGMHKYCNALCQNSRNQYSKSFFVLKFSNGKYNGLKITAVQYLPVQDIYIYMEIKVNIFPLSPSLKPVLFSLRPYLNKSVSTRLRVVEFSFSSFQHVHDKTRS